MWRQVPYAPLTKHNFRIYPAYTSFAAQIRYLIFIKVTITLLFLQLK